MARMSREVREARAIMVAEKQLEKRLDTIAWEEEILYPALDRVKAGELTVRHVNGSLEVVRELEAGDAG